ncbi:MAG TPA: ABC transporter permease [Rhodocyclaceae bacterium]|nr:ABC transporter permease [Rhodocyclaceae bacterium]
MSDTRIEVVAGSEAGRRVMLSGRWTLMAIGPRIDDLMRQLTTIDGHAEWDCRAVDALDSAGAMLLWRAWGRQLPATLLASQDHLRVFERVAAADRQEPLVHESLPTFHWLLSVGEQAIAVGRHLVDFLMLSGQMMLNLAKVIHHPGELPGQEISANLYKSGVRAMPVSALVGFLIGVVLSYLSALQLRQLGADVFIVDILGLGIIREIGPVLIAVLVAGRSGSAMTAQLGVMRVTEEIDALATMGVPTSLRLIFPKVVALAVAMPLLVLWIIVLALAGGMVTAQIQLDIGYQVFFDQLPKAVPVANLWIGLAKGVVFGIFVALVACHFGLRVQPNTESLSAHTTASVVTSITVVILLDAVFAILTRSIGVP